MPIMGTNTLEVDLENPLKNGPLKSGFYIFHKDLPNSY